MPALVRPVRHVAVALAAPARALAIALLLLAAVPGVALAHHPGEADPRCADWTANGAPAGIDLGVVCMANRIVGNYTTDQATDPGLLPYAGAALAFGVVMAIVAVAAWRVTSRPVARRLASVTPAAWWVCPSCRSLNAAGREACYACRTAAPATATAPDALMPTADEPPFDQRTGLPV